MNSYVNRLYYFQKKFIYKAEILDKKTLVRNRIFGGKVLNTKLLFIIINSGRLFLKIFRELPRQLALMFRTQEEWLLLVISIIYLLSAKLRNLLWRYSILNAHCKHIIFLFDKFFEAEAAYRVTAFVSEISIYV